MKTYLVIGISTNAPVFGEAGDKGIRFADWVEAESAAAAEKEITDQFPDILVAGVLVTTGDRSEIQVVS